MYRIDSRTCAVDGCGSRIIYIESCQPIRGEERCTWMIDARYETTPASTPAGWRPAQPPPPGTSISNPKGVLDRRD